VRSYNGLKNANIQTVGELVQKSEADILEMQNFGRGSLNDIKDALAKIGLHLGMEVDEGGKLVAPVFNNKQH
jgi:DNA-directed RNA polymerase subunit alpha